MFDGHRKASLSVEKVEKGSMFFYLVDLVGSTFLPFAENFNTIIGFTEYLKKVYDFFIHGKGDNPNLNGNVAQDFHDSLVILANDNKGTMNLDAINKTTNTIINNYNFTFTEANAGQNQFLKVVETLKNSIPKSEKFIKQIMVIDQHRGDISKDKGNRAKIESICHKALPVVFEEDDIKSQILDSEHNPTKRAYLVDVETQTINGKIAVYKVLALHDTIDLDE